MTPDNAPPGESPQEARIGTGLALLLAVACGVSVANIYYAEPVLDRIGHDLGIAPADLGIVDTVTQSGYLLGLVLIVPLGDLMNRRVLIIVQCTVVAAALVAVSLARAPVVFLIAIGVVGLFSVVVQVIVAYAAVLSDPRSRGRTVGVVTSGVVCGILLARTLSGLLAEAFGWRSVYVVSALMSLTLALTLSRLLPRDLVSRQHVSYGRLVTSVFTLTARERTFRVRSLIGLFMFAGFGALWGSVVLPLTAEPWHLSSGQVGLFGIAGAAGALGAARAGTLADRGLGRRVTGSALVLFLLSWALIAQAPHSLIALGAGIVLLDFAGQALHVTNQNMIINIRPGAGSRLIGSYMVYYSVGIAGGAITATTVYGAWGWSAVCALGAAYGTAALAIWALDEFLTSRRPRAGRPATAVDHRSPSLSLRRPA
ncbi:MFS transporter [Actinomadura rubrisoli]|uniref:MFS transporter n=1 Tax=Actinomadura rubrisoli TaxID=2530368 RepID=A0A4R5CAS0_9ACTN|nr:MFS transporter [Actinomadura rubrisoli]TDD96435.1 MFS transporter [Actinomadura rubrisoli]